MISISESRLNNLEGICSFLPLLNVLRGHIAKAGETKPHILSVLAPFPFPGHGPARLTAAIMFTPE